MNLPEIIITGHDGYSKNKVYQLAKKGVIRQLIIGVYTSNFLESDEIIFRKNWQHILSQLYPQSILSHRTALEFRPSEKGNIYVTYNTRRTLRWPGLTIKMIDGYNPIEGDNSIFGELYVSSFERALLENLSVSRTVDGERRTLPQQVIEERLIQILNIKGEGGLNLIRNKARKISADLGWDKSFKKLDVIIGALLNSRSTDKLTSEAGRAISIGEPFDASRVQLFTHLAADLRSRVFTERLMKTTSPESYNNLAFIESYFSNYIEGTEFAIEEAIDILLNHVEIPNRTGDSHDIRGTYELCSNQKIMSTSPSNPIELIELLKLHHSKLLQGRPEKLPGKFKSRANRAGNTYFVQPNQVIGTLKQGFQIRSAIDDPLARAIYMMFLISEVHPFNDGNGRIARLMMNIELSEAGYSKIIIPNVYRDDYLLNLRALTRKQNTNKFIKMMDKAQKFTHWLEPDNLNIMIMQLNGSNAFMDSNEAALRFEEYNIN